MTETEPADPRARRTALIVVAGGTLAGIAALTLGTSSPFDVVDWVDHEPASRVPLLVLGMLVLLSLPLLALAAYLWALGRRIVNTQRFPPAGMRVIRDTPVLTGDAALRRGRWLQLLAVTLGLLSLALAILLWQLGSLLGG